MEKQQLKLDQKQNLKYPDVMERSYIYNSQSLKSTKWNLTLVSHAHALMQLY